MVTDAVLWFILASAIVLVGCGCRYTRPLPKRYDATFADKIDRAA